MSRSSVFRRLARAMWLGTYCERRSISTTEGIERIALARHRAGAQRRRRREFLASLGRTAGLTAITTGLGRLGHAVAAPPGRNLDVAIVGGGIAGLACADRLRSAGISATLYEARDRLGGRIWSMGGAFPGPVEFPGQIVERGGEFIDNLHLTMKSYAREFALELEDMEKEWLPGETTWFFGGAPVPETVIVDEFRELVDAMRPDLADLSAEVTATSFTEFDRQIDHTNLLKYLESRGAGPNIKAAIDVSYTTEYGREIFEQSALNFIFFIHADKRSKFTPFGVFSDERWHVVTGNQGIPEGIARRLNGTIELETRLLAARMLSDGRLELSFDQNGSLFTARHDAVVLAVPFSMLREVELDASLGLPAEKRFAIDNLMYGTNAKMNVGFHGAFWSGRDSNGESWSDLPHHQLAWEVNPSLATEDHAVLVDYSGGERGAALSPRNVSREAKRFLTDLDTILPGALEAAVRTGPGQFLAHLQHWPSDPLIRGSYTCSQPGYFTSILGHEATPVGNLFFAGEHTDSFYEWQGFMEGAANSGIRAAQEVLRASS